MVYPVFGKYQKATEEARKLVVFDPEFPIGYYQLAFNYTYLDRLAEAENALQRAAARKLEIPELSIQRYDIAFLKNDKAGMEREATLGHQGAEAAAEFQKILDHRGIVISDPIGALAHLQLGRAFAMSGEKTKAKTAYQSFLTLWKDADADIPILKQAKAEYAKLP